MGAVMNQRALDWRLPAWAPRPWSATTVHQTPVTDEATAARVDAIDYADLGEWGRYGACLNSDPDRFFLDKGENHPDADHAQAICRGCPVRAQCDEYAITHRISPGLWAGRGGTHRRKAWVPRGKAASAAGRPVHAPQPATGGRAARLDEVPQVMRSVIELTRQGMQAKPIAARLGVNARTVTRWRAKARTMGLLPEYVPPTPLDRRRADRDAKKRREARAA